MKIIIIFTIFICLIICSYSYATTELCKRCCIVTPSGCINSNTFNLRGLYTSYISLCKTVDCSINCGWIANNYQKVECTTCDYINSMITNKVVYI